MIINALLIFLLNINITAAVPYQERKPYMSNEIAKNTIQDPITQRISYEFATIEQIPSDIIDKIDLANKEKFVVASYNNSLRFLLSDGSLVVVNEDSPVSLYKKTVHSFEGMSENNYISFYLDHGVHAQIEFECNSCNAGYKQHKFYDLDARVRESDTFLSRSDLPFANLAAIGQPLKFYLSDVQASEVYKSITDIASLSAKGLYKWAPVIQNCVKLLTDVYKQSGFSYHFSNYYSDEDLLINIAGDTGRPAFYQRDVNLNPVADPGKKDVSDFLAAEYGDQYPKNWLKIRNQPVDLSKVQASAKLKARIEEYNEIRQSTCSIFISNIMDDDNTERQKAITLCIERPITNENLMSIHTPTYELEILKPYKNTKYHQYVIAPFGYDINKACNNFKDFKNNLAELCQIWCHIQNEHNMNNTEEVCSSWQQVEITGVTAGASNDNIEKDL